MVAACGLRVIPVGVVWPAHRAVSGLGAGRVGALEAVFGSLGLVPDRALGHRSAVVDAGLAAHLREPLWSSSGTGLLARWAVDEEALRPWRSMLLRLPPATVAALRQAGNRWATLSSTVLKNADTAASSWASASTGEMSEPTVRQPVLLGLR